jgi:hypothetical protein
MKSLDTPTCKERLAGLIVAAVVTLLLWFGIEIEEKP